MNQREYRTLILRHDPCVKQEHAPGYKGPWDIPQHENLLKRIRRADGLSAVNNRISSASMLKKGGVPYGTTYP